MQWMLYCTMHHFEKPCSLQTASQERTLAVSAQQALCGPGKVRTSARATLGALAEAPVLQKKV